MLRVTFPAQAEDDELVAFTLAIRTIYRTTNHEVTWILDCSRVRKVSAKQRGILAKHEEDIKPFARRYNAGLAFVIASPLVRGMITAVTWLAPLVYPHDIFADMPSAEAWCRGQLARAQARAP
jgi:hypothetical protein